MITQPWLEFRQGSLVISFFHCFFKENEREREERRRGKRRGGEQERNINIRGSH